MLLFMALSNLLCLLLPALIAASVTTQEGPVNLAAHHVKRLSTPLKNLLQRRDAIIIPGSPNAHRGVTLNSTNGEVAQTEPFEEDIDIPDVGRVIYFLLKGEIDEDYSVTVEFWVHYHVDRRIGVYHGDLVQGSDMKIPANIKVVDGEARLYVVTSGAYDVLVFEAYGSVHLPTIPNKNFSRFKKEIKRWKVGILNSIEDVPNNSGVQTLSSNAGVDTSFSIE